MPVKPLILLHGALGTEEDLLPLKSTLPEHLQALTLTFQGHGGKSLTGAFSISGFVAELSAFIQHHKLEQPILFGYSMGGYVALSLAVSEPGLLGGIITLGTKIDWNPEFTIQEVARLKPEVVQEKIPAFADTLKKRHGKDWKIILQRTAFMMETLCGTRDAFLKQLLALDLPVRIGRGERDKIVSREECQLACQAIKNALYYELPDSGHQLEQVNISFLAGYLQDFQKTIG